MDVVVTDHHRPGDELPDCPVVHPGRLRLPVRELCATGVAYKLAQALFAAAGRDPAELGRELDIVALATVADLVPLRRREPHARAARPAGAAGHAAARACAR